MLKLTLSFRNIGSLLHFADSSCYLLLTFWKFCYTGKCLLNWKMLPLLYSKCQLPWIMHYYYHFIHHLTSYALHLTKLKNRIFENIYPTILIKIATSILTFSWRKSLSHGPPASLTEPHWVPLTSIEPHWALLDPNDFRWSTLNDSPLTHNNPN